jgi:hypothetical protein
MQELYFSNAHILHYICLFFKVKHHCLECYTNIFWDHWLLNCTCMSIINHHFSIIYNMVSVMLNTCQFCPHFVLIVTVLMTYNYIIQKRIKMWWKRFNFECNIYRRDHWLLNCTCMSIINSSFFFYYQTVLNFENFVVFYLNFISNIMQDMGIWKI